MNIEQIEGFVPLFQTLVWAVLIAVVGYSLRKNVTALLDKFTGADELEMSLGCLSVQATTMRELRQSIGIGFPDGQINKSEIDALIDIKMRSIQAAMERTLSTEDIRIGSRLKTNEKISIARENGEIIQGNTIDVSDAGIGFKSDQRLRFAEIVKISAFDGNTQELDKISDTMRIVRIEEAKEGYHYGATLPSAL